MNHFQDTLFSLPQFNDLTSLISQKKSVQLNGISGSFRTFVLNQLYSKTKAPLLYLANSLESAEKVHDDLDFIFPELKSVFLPGLFTEPYDQALPRPELISIRLEALQKFLEADRWICVANFNALMEKLPGPENFMDTQVYLRKGQNISFEDLMKSLTTAGLDRMEIVEQVGEFAVRGGIIDLFAWNNEDPIRIEFFGNQIESIRKFDVISQKTIELVEEFTILPNGLNTNNSVFLWDILPENSIIFFEESDLLFKKTTEFYQNAERLFAENKELEVSFGRPEDIYPHPEIIKRSLSKYLEVNTNLVKNDTIAEINFPVKKHPDFHGNIKLFLEFIQSLPPKNKIVIQSSSQEQANRLREIIEEEDIQLNASFPVGTFHEGFIIDPLDLIVLTDHQIFKRFKRHKTYKSFKSGAYLRQLSSLSLYDYIVHIDYGIGQYIGLEVLSYGNVKKECLKILYQDNDYLYVTVDRLNRIQKYSSEDAAVPALTKLGSTEWERTKQKTKESLKKVASELIQIYAGRKAQPGYSFGQDNHWQKELEASFEYEETEDQLRSIKEVKIDMEKEKPMDRLLCGDVGFGKTEVALRAAFKTVMSGKQAAILVPTTILAFQHNETFSQRLNAFPVKVEMLNRFKTPKQQKHIIEQLVSGEIDILIGTHRLLSEDVTFKDLGILIIDEEQRFGVKHKEKLKEYRLSVDVLSMTATPIPRTLHMALLGARDFSNIETPPRNRLPVHTEIIHWNDVKIFNIIKREIQRGGQIYFVHNRVETIQAVKDNLEQIIPQARVVVAHGQLPERKLEKVMLDFMHYEFDILVASMIIENGLDIPNVNTIIINRADKFGLAQLYQLRGRVGRSDKQAYAYLIVPAMDKITELARKRLRTIQDFTELGSGYKVALRDLEIRGAGNLLGKQQSGFVQSVGFDLYCKLLEDAVKELKQDVTELADQAVTEKEFTDPKLDVNFNLLIPHSYIKNDLERVSIYHRLVNFRDLNNIESMRAELNDRFGKMPEQVELFFEAIILKVLAGYLFASRLGLSANSLKIIFDKKAQESEPFFKVIIPAIMATKMTKIKFLNQKDLGVQMDLKGTSNIEKMEFAKKVLQNIVDTY